MKLKQLLKVAKVKIFNGNKNIEIDALFCDSRVVDKDNSLFFCLNGEKQGIKYVDEAIKKGVIAVIVERQCDYEFMINNYKNITTVLVNNARSAMSNMAKCFYCPSLRFKIIGVTGTNGKTTITYMMCSILRRAKYNVGIIGTSGVFFNYIELQGETLTTPDPIDLFRIFKLLNDLGADYVLIEASSHALYWNKLKNVVSDYSIFTNLTEDHLDFFKTMQEYGKIKSKYFSKTLTNFSVINTDDDYGKVIYKNCRTEKANYSMLDKNADIYAFKYNEKKQRFKIKYGKSIENYKLNIYGKYNVYNALVCIYISKQLNINKKIIYKGLKYMPKINGRYNIYKFKKNGIVILDFAHTPDGLEKILTSARTLVKNNGRLISLFGCGGNRDEQKRAIMGKIASTFADYIIISIDNPRYEDPYIVMNDVASGIIDSKKSKYEIVMPRAEAIRKAISMTKRGDVIVVSGKGTEPYYEVNGEKLEYHEDKVIEKLQEEFKNGGKKIQC